MLNLFYLLYFLDFFHFSLLFHVLTCNFFRFYQHLRINVFRAIENRRPILRSANSGISAFIDSLGKIQYQAGLNEEVSEIIELTLPKTPVLTFYTIYGDIFAFLCLFLTLVFSYNCLELSQDYD